MKTIPKKISVKNTIWKCYSLLEMIIALFTFMIIFLLFTNGYIVLTIILNIIFIILYIPTGEGLFYEFLIEVIKYLFSNKQYNKKYIKDKESICNLLQIKNITDEGIIEYKGNTLSKVINIGQKNFFIQDNNEQDIDIETFNNVLKQLDFTTPVDIIKIDRPLNLDSYSNELFNKIKLINENKIDKSIISKKEKILNERINYIDKINNLTKQYIPYYYIVIYSTSIDNINLLTDNINLEISKCGISTKVLNKREVSVFLKYNFTRNFDEREINDISDEELINWIIPNEIKLFSNKMIIDNVESSILSINDYPMKVKNGWGEYIFNTLNTKVVMHINPVEKQKAIKRIDKNILEMETQEIMNTNASEINNANMYLQSMNDLLNSLQNEDESLLETTITITSYNYDNEHNYKKNLKRKIQNKGFKLLNLFCLQNEGLISSLPINNFKLKKYQRSINSLSLASSFPFSKKNIMDEDGIVLGQTTSNNYPFIFNIWKRGDLYQNSNAFVIGQSGSGKTYFLKNLIINEWSNNTKIIICDPEAEYIYLTKNISGNTIDVGNSKDGIINPFHIYQILTDEGNNASPIVTFNTHLKTLESFFKIVLNGVSTDILELINMLVIDTYGYKGITEETDCSSYKPSYFPIFSDMLYVLEEKQKNTDNDYIYKNYEIAKIHLQKFVNGRYSDIWNSPSTLQFKNDIIDFNFQSLFANKNNVVANAQMLLIFRFIEQEIINTRENNKKNPLQKTMIIIDEAHLFIDPKYPIALDFFYQMNKRIRKYGGSFIPATQNISDWNSNEELRYKTSTIIKNSQYSFIFKLSSPDMNDVLDIYKVGNSFNKEERKIIITSKTGQAFFIGSTELRGSVKIIANDYIRQLFDEENNNEEDI